MTDLTDAEKAELSIYFQTIDAEQGFAVVASIIDGRTAVLRSALSEAQAENERLRENALTDLAAITDRAYAQGRQASQSWRHQW